MSEKKVGFFNKKTDTSLKSIPKPQSAFTADNTELLGSIKTQEDILKTNNKSLGIPASIWCSYMALLDVTDNDYTYELLEELIQERIHKLPIDKKKDYERQLERKEDYEREKLQKKINKRK